MPSSEQMLFGEQTRSAIARDTFKKNQRRGTEAESNYAGGKIGKPLTTSQSDGRTQQS
jgi:hypothetical protein